MTNDEWYERERAAFIAWWESEGQEKFGTTPTMAAGAGWLAKAERVRPEARQSWISVKDRLPADNENCILYGDDAGRVAGPFIFKVDGKGGMWIDLFATPEAGAAYSVDQGVTHWQKWIEPEESSPQPQRERTPE